MRGRPLATDYHRTSLLSEPRYPFIVTNGVVAVMSVASNQPVHITPPGGLWPGWTPPEGYYVELTDGARLTPPDCDPSVLRAARANLEWAIFTTADVLEGLRYSLGVLGRTSRPGLAYALQIKPETLTQRIHAAVARKQLAGIKRTTYRAPGSPTLEYFIELDETNGEVAA